MRFGLGPLLAAERSALGELAENGRNYAERMQMALPVSGEDWEALCAGASCMAAMEEIPAFLRSADAVNREFEYPKSCLRQRALARKKKEDLLRLWNENFLRMDMEYFRDKFDQANKKFFGKGRALSALTAELQAYASFPVQPEKIPAYLTEVTFCQLGNNATGRQGAGEQGESHERWGGAGGGAGPDQEKRRDANQKRTGETDQLPFR